MACNLSPYKKSLGEAQNAEGLNGTSIQVDEIPHQYVD